MASIADFVIVLTTLPADTDAMGFARTLVTERLAACVSLLPEMRSIYWWDGAVQDEAERQVVIKTAQSRLAALKGRIRDLHPYRVPELIVLPIADGTADYLGWIGESVTG